MEKLNIQDEPDINLPLMMNSRHWTDMYNHFQANDITKMIESTKLYIAEKITKADEVFATEASVLKLIEKLQPEKISTSRVFYSKDELPIKGVWSSTYTRDDALEIVMNTNDNYITDYEYLCPKQYLITKLGSIEKQMKANHIEPSFKARNKNSTSIARVHFSDVYRAIPIKRRAMIDKLNLALTESQATLVYTWFSAIPAKLFDLIHVFTKHGLDLGIPVWFTDLQKISLQAKANPMDEYNLWLIEITGLASYSTLPIPDVNTHDTILEQVKETVSSTELPYRPQGFKRLWLQCMGKDLELAMINLEINGLYEYIVSGEWANASAGGIKLGTGKDAIRLTKAQVWAITSPEDLLKHCLNDQYATNVFIKEELGKTRAAYSLKAIGVYIRNSWILSEKRNMYERFVGAEFDKNGSLEKRILRAQAAMKRGDYIACTDAKSFDSQQTLWEIDTILALIYTCKGQGQWVSAANRSSIKEMLFTWEGVKLPYKHGLASGVRETTATHVVWNTIMIIMARSLARVVTCMTGVQYPIGYDEYDVRGDDVYTIDARIEDSKLFVGILLDLGYKMAPGKSTLGHEIEFLRAHYTKTTVYKYPIRRLNSAFNRKPWGSVLPQIEGIKLVCEGIFDTINRLPALKDVLTDIRDSFLSRHQSSYHFADTASIAGGAGSPINKISTAIYASPKVIREGEYLDFQPSSSFMLKYGKDADKQRKTFIVNKPVLYDNKPRILNYGKTQSSFEAIMLASTLESLIKNTPYIVEKTYIENDKDEKVDVLAVNRLEDETDLAYLKRVYPRRVDGYQMLLGVYPHVIAFEMIMSDSQYIKCPYKSLVPMWNRFSIGSIIGKIVLSAHSKGFNTRNLENFLSLIRPVNNVLMFYYNDFVVQV